MHSSIIAFRPSERFPSYRPSLVNQRDLALAYSPGVAYACLAILLAGCGSSTPSWNFMPSLSGGTSVSLTIESDPPGADAKTSLGPTCRTPCILRFRRTAN